MIRDEGSSSQRSAVFLPGVAGAGLTEGETGQAKPDWPVSADLP